MKKILVTGSQGQLGNEIAKLARFYPGFEFIFKDIDELDISDRIILLKFLSEHHPEIIINAAAYTNVDRAETETEKAFLVNAYAPGLMADYCKEQNALLIHISTDYVFDGKKNSPYVESDETNPVSVYGKSKLSGEENILKIDPRALIIRTSWLYSSFGKNFVKTIIKLAREKKQIQVVNDQLGSPTYAADLAKAILDITERETAFYETDIFHFTNSGVTNWFELASTVLGHKSIDCKIIPVSTEEYPVVAKRPQYSVLSTEKISQRFGILVPFWEDSIKVCLALIE